jgi:hypothetical protein
MQSYLLIFPVILALPLISFAHECPTQIMKDTLRRMQSLNKVGKHEEALIYKANAEKQCTLESLDPSKIETGLWIVNETLLAQLKMNKIEDCIKDSHYQLYGYYSAMGNPYKAEKPNAPVIRALLFNANACLDAWLSQNTNGLKQKDFTESKTIHSRNEKVKLEESCDEKSERCTAETMTLYLGEKKLDLAQSMFSVKQVKQSEWCFQVKQLEENSRSPHFVLVKGASRPCLGGTGSSLFWSIFKYESNQNALKVIKELTTGLH